MGFVGPLRTKVSAAGSIIATKAVTLVSSGGYICLYEFLVKIALIGQGTVSTKL